MLNLFIFTRKEKVRLKLAHKLIPTLSLEKLEKSTMSKGEVDSISYIAIKGR